MQNVTFLLFKLERIICHESFVIANLTVQVLGGHGFLSRAASLQISLICKGLVVETANNKKVYSS